MKTDKRIRIFTHLKNMGAWRSRLDAFLYSNAPYVIHFYAGDFYSDNYVLEDIYYLANKYKLDSLRFSFRLTKEKTHLSHKDIIFTFEKKDRKIVYGRRKYSVYGFRYGTIWNRLTKAEVFVKGLLYLDEYILNAYKNLFDDRWWNTLGNNESHSFLMINRLGYIYLKDFNGEGNIKSGNEKLNEKSIKEIIYFFLFDYYLSYNKSDKKDIINALRGYQKGKNHLKLSDLKTYFKPYEHLLHLLINDKYVSKQNKLYLLSLKSYNSHYFQVYSTIYHHINFYKRLKYTHQDIINPLEKLQPLLTYSIWSHIYNHIHYIFFFRILFFYLSFQIYIFYLY